MANLHVNRNQPLWKKPSKNDFLKIEGSETQKLLQGNKPSIKILWNHNDLDVRKPLEFPKYPYISGHVRWSHIIL